MNRIGIVLLFITFINLNAINDSNINKDYSPLFKNKNILITGGTGFIGSSLISEILKYNPKKITIYSRDEVKHFKIELTFSNNLIKSIVGDVRDYNRLLEATKDQDIVIHAAALKRLDILEDNPEESVKTNILGSLNLIKACKECKVKKCVLISTDKACAPINVYGASKFISERIFSSQLNDITKFLIVRYGNVSESTGSVIPIFKDILKNNKDINITDPRMTRFIISNKQAVNLIFNSLLNGQGGEIFVPKLPAYNIMTLAKVLKDTYNSTSNIKVTGIRPGEKLHESMINCSEMSRTIDKGNLFVIYPSTFKMTDKAMKDILGENEYTSKNSVIDEKELRNVLSQNDII